MISSQEHMRYLKSFKNYILNKIDLIPDVAIILGSGLMEFQNDIEFKGEVSYSELAGFPTSTNENHHGKFILGRVDNVNVICMCGRVHYYEGYNMTDIIVPVRVMGLLGAKSLIVTNAAGGISDYLNQGDLMLITDHISSFVNSPLVGPNFNELGVRFPDQSCVYSKRLQKIAKRCAKNLGIELKEGVFLQNSGPQYETPAEIRMFEILGANAVGMSTTVESLAATHMGMEVCGISVITNKAAGKSSDKLDDSEVIETGKSISEKFTNLVTSIVKSI